MSKARSPRGRSPPVFSVRASLKLYRPVFRVLKPRVALPAVGWHPYTSRTVKRGVGPRVALCEHLRDWVHTEPQNQPRPTRHFFTQFLGQCRRSIFAQDKAVAPPLRTPSRNAGRKGNSRAILANHGTFPGKSSDINFQDFGHTWLLVWRKCPPLSHFQWLRYGSYSVFPEKTPSKSSLWRICNDRRKDPHAVLFNILAILFFIILE